MSSSTLQNIVIGILALVLVVLGYFLFIKPSSFSLSDATTSPLEDQIETRTQEFISRREQLSGVALDQSMFMDSRFTTLRSYTPAAIDQTLGKTSLFDGLDELQGSSDTTKATH